MAISQTSPGHAGVRPMSSADLTQVVDVHVEGFPGFFLTSLGPRFLRLLYEGIIEHPDGIAFVADGDGRVRGFVAGVTQQGAFYRRLIARRKWAFAMAAASAALRRPAIVLRLLRALHRPAEVDASVADACLMSIAVRPDVQGQGTGRALVEAFCRELAARGADQVCLTTDCDHNDAANRFYRRLGFRPARRFVTPEGRPMNEYVLDLAPPPPRPGLARHAVPMPKPSLQERSTHA